jgi:excisionase family DNA binding protein
MPHRKLTYDVKEVAQVLGISINIAYREIASGRIPSMRLGRKILVSKDALESWIREEASAH